MTSYTNIPQPVGKTPFLASYSFYEIHASDTISATPKRIIEAVSRLDMREDFVARLMLSLRELPTKLLHKVFHNKYPENNAPFGFDSFTKLNETENEISLGLIGKFWRPDLVIETIHSSDEFYAFSDKSMAKLVLRFQVIEQYNENPMLVTETFIYCPNLRTKMFFTPYWLVIRLASGWLRKRTLANIKKKLED